MALTLSMPATNILVCLTKYILTDLGAAKTSATACQPYQSPHTPVLRRVLIASQAVIFASHLIRVCVCVVSWGRGADVRITIKSTSAPDDMGLNPHCGPAVLG
eukprot:jgi/Chrzof1/7858/Cz02g39030.t1